MKARSGFTAGALLLSAASGLMLCQSVSLWAQTDKDSASAPSAEKSAEATATKSAIQKELDRLYEQQGQQAPKLTAQAALENLQDSRTPTAVTKQGEQISSSKTPSLSADGFLDKLRNLIPGSKPAPKVTPQAPVRKQVRPDYAISPGGKLVKAQVKPAAVRTADSNADAAEKSAIVQTSQTEEAAPQAAKEDSAVMQQLKKLYARDGLAMPEMKLEKVARKAPAAQVATVKPTADPISTPKPADNSSTISGMLKRFLPTHKTSVTSSKSSRPRISSQRSSRLWTEPATQVVEKAAKPEPVQAAKEAVVVAAKKEVAPAAPKANVAAPALAAKPAPQAKETVKLKTIPDEKVPATKVAAKPKTLPIETAAKPAKVEPAKSDLDNPFSEVSEAAADKKMASPFSGLSLNDDAKPAKDAAKSAKAAEKPAKVAAKPKVEINPAKQTTQEAQHQEKFARIAEREGLDGFKGFCPVALRDQRKLIDAQPEFKSFHDGEIYQFSSADAKAKFDQNPASYVPAAKGKDVTLLSDSHEVSGSLDHAIWYRNQLYMFSSQETLTQFVAQPASYVTEAK